MVVKIYEHVASGKEVRFGDWSGKEVDYLNTLQLLTAKPVVYLCNVNQADYIRKKNKYLMKIKQWVDEREAESPIKPAIIPICVDMEMAATALGSPEEKEEFFKSRGTTSIMPRIITTGYKALNLIYYFTQGDVEVRAWTIRVRVPAAAAAAPSHLSARPPAPPPPPFVPCNRVLPP